jgi:hypothetical protein
MESSMSSALPPDDSRAASADTPAHNWPTGRPAPLEAPGRRRHAAELESDPTVLTPAAFLVGLRASVRWRDVVSALVVTLVLAASGLVTGVLWAWMAPHVPVLMTSNGPILAEYYGESAFGAQAIYGAIGLVVGAVLGPVTYLVRRARGPIMLIGLAAGCLAAAWVAWKVGAWVGRDHYRDLLHHAANGRRFGMPVNLDAKGLMFLEPLVAVLGYVVVAAWSHSADLGVSGAPYRKPRHGTGSGD